MAKTQDTKAKTVDTPTNGSNSAEVPDVYNRGINDRVRFKSINIRRTLTKPIIAVAHRNELMVRIDSEPYTMPLPLAKQSERLSDATVIDVTEHQPLGDGEFHLSEGILVLNAVMKSAFERAGSPLTGRYFVIVAGDIRADKRYRNVDVRELAIDWEA